MAVAHARLGGPAQRLALTSEAQKAVSQKKHAVQVRRYFDVLRLKFLIVEEERRKTIEVEYEEHVEELAEARALDWEVTWGSDKDAAACMEVAYRRNEGRKVLVAKRDRELHALSSEQEAVVAQLRAQSAGDVAAAVEEQRRDLEDLPEEAAAPIRKRMNQQIAVLQGAAKKKVNGIEANHQKTFGITARKWDDELRAYDATTKNSHALFMLIAREEQVRGNGAPWRVEWWAREAPPTAAAEASPHLPSQHRQSVATSGRSSAIHTPSCQHILPQDAPDTDSSEHLLATYRGPRDGVLYGGYHFEEQQGRQVVYLWCRSVAGHCLIEAELHDDFTDESYAIWKYMMVERHGIQRKEFKQGEAAARRGIYIENHIERCEKIRILLTCDEMEYRFNQELAAASWWENAWEDFHSTRIFLAKWLGIRFYERKEILSEEEYGRINRVQDEDHGALLHLEDHVSWVLWYDEWVDRRRVERLEIELHERAVFDSDVFLPRCEGLNQHYAKFIEKLHWLQKIELSQLGVRVHVDIEEEAMRRIDLITLEDFGWGWIAETWEENYRKDRRKLEFLETVERFPIESESDYHMDEDGTLDWYNQWVKDIVHVYWQWKHGHERKTLEEVEEFMRTQLGYLVESDEVWFHYRVDLLPIQVQFLDEKHAIERAAMEDVEAVLRWQCEEEDYMNRFYEVECDRWQSWRFLMYQHLEEKHAIERMLFERDNMERRILEIESEENEAYVEDLYWMHFRAERIQIGQQALAELQCIERAAMEDVEEFVRWQMEDVTVTRFETEMVWYHEWIELVHEFWVEKHMIERRGLNEVETVMRSYCELSYEKIMSQERFQLERGVMCVQFWMTLEEIERYAMLEVEFVFRWQLRVQEFEFNYDILRPWWHEHVVIVDDYWQRKHWLQRKLMCDEEDTRRLVSDCEYETFAIEQDWWLTWGVAATDFLNVKHIMEQQETMFREEQLRFTKQGVMEMEQIGILEEPCVVSYLHAKFLEGIFLYYSRILCRQEETARFFVAEDEDVRTVCFDEEKAYIEFKLAFLYWQHAIYQWYAHKDEAKHRFQIADEPLARSDVELVYWEGLTVHSGEFRAEKHRLERKELGDVEEQQRLGLEEELERWRITHAAVGGGRALYVRHEEVMWDVRWQVLFRIEREERDRLSGVLLSKWEEFFKAVCDTIGYIRKAAATAATQRKKMVEFEQHAFGLREAMDRKNIAEREAKHSDFVFTFFPKALMFSLREQETRLILHEARERMITETNIELHLHATIDRFRKAIKQLLNAEHRETTRYQKWRHTAPTGLLKLMRAAGESVKPETTAYKGLRRLHRCVLFSLRQIEKDEHKKEAEKEIREGGGYSAPPPNLRHAPAYAHLAQYGIGQMMGPGGYPSHPSQVVVHSGVVRPLIRIDNVRMIEQETTGAVDESRLYALGGAVSPGVTYSPYSDDPFRRSPNSLSPLPTGASPARSTRSLSSLNDSPKTAELFRGLASPKDRAVDLSEVKLEVLQKKPLYLGEVGSPLPTLTVYFSHPCSGAPVHIPGTLVNFRLKNSDTALLSAVNQNMTVFEVVVVPACPGAFRITLQALFQGEEEARASVKIKVSVEVDRPDGVSDGAWRLFKLLQQRIGDAQCEGDLDEHARFMLSAVRQNRHFAQLGVQLGARYPWLAPPPPRGGRTPTLAPLNYVPVQPLSRPKRPKASPRKDGRRSQLPPLKNSPEPPPADAQSEASETQPAATPPPILRPKSV